MKTLRKISTFAAALGLVFVVGCESSRTQTSVGEQIDDSVVTAKVKAALVEDDDLSASEINVETFKGRVQLSGFVSERSDIAKASELVDDIDGVASIQNDLVVK